MLVQCSYTYPQSFNDKEYGYCLKREIILSHAVVKVVNGATL